MTCARLDASSMFRAPGFTRGFLIPHRSLLGDDDEHEFLTFPNSARSVGELGCIRLSGF